MDCHRSACIRDKRCLPIMRRRLHSAWIFGTGVPAFDTALIECSYWTEPIGIKHPSSLPGRNGLRDRENSRGSWCSVVLLASVGCVL
jgi:hypothetical protein